MKKVTLDIWKTALALRCGLIAFFALFAISGPWVASAADENLRYDKEQWEHAGSLESIRLIAEINTNIHLTDAKLPPDKAEVLFGTRLPHSRVAMNRSDWPELSFWWAPTEFSHWPLYLDDVPLERYGQTPCRLAQPGLSGLHFFGNVALLPYELLVDFPLRRVTQLGYYRSGSDAPPVRERLLLAPSPAFWSHIAR